MKESFIFTITIQFHKIAMISEHLIILVNRSLLFFCSLSELKIYVLFLSDLCRKEKPDSNKAIIRIAAIRKIE